MNKKLTLTLFAALLSIAHFAFAENQTPDQSLSFSQVLIEGNRNVDTAAVKAQLKHLSGTATKEMISEEVKALYKTEFFDDVSAQLVNLNGKQTLKYVVVEKPLVRKSYIKGNKNLTEDELAKVLNLGAKRFMDKGRIEALMRSGVAYYQKEGYYDATFDYSVVPVGEGQVDLTFNVNEGKKVKIRRISVEGLNKLDEGDLLSEMQTRSYKWYNSWLFGTGRLNKDMLDNDKLILRQYFLDHGYVDGNVGDPVIERKDDGLYIKFFANEGEQYKFGNVSVTGDLVEESPDLTLKDTAIKSGEVFSAAKLREDSFKISDKFADKGFAFVNVVPNTLVNKDSKSVDVEYSINKGKQVHVGKIKIKGNTKTYDNVIRRELKLDEQDLYSASKMRRSQELLQRLGYFEEATVNMEPSKDPDKVDLDVNVREGSTGQFSAGVGFSSAEGVLFNARVAENNLMGTGRSADINFDIGTENNNLIIDLNDRRFQDTYLALGASAFRTVRQFTDFDRTLTGGSVTAGYPLEQVFGEWAQDISTSLKYEALNIKIDNIQDTAAQLVKDSAGTSTESGFTPAITRSTLNSPIDPTEGSLQEVSVELAGAGGDQEFYLIEGRQSLYYPLLKFGNGPLVFSIRTKVGYGETFNDDPFPLFRRYFPGGINSVRGYKNRSLGPKDANGNEFGGSKQLVNNAELIFPLVGSAGLKGVAFYDAGEAFDDNKDIDIADLRQAYGLGIRWSSPIGPIRVEFGFPIERQQGERRMVTNFSFGAPF